MPDYDGMPIMEDYADDDIETYHRELRIYVARREIPILEKQIKDEPETPVRKITDEDMEASGMSGGELHYHALQSFRHNNFNRNRNIKSLKDYRDILKEYNVKETK